MSDVNISVGVNDAGGADVIDKITAALKRLRDAKNELAKVEGEGQLRDEKGRFLTQQASDARRAAAASAVQGAKDTVEAIRRVIAIEQEATKQARAAANERAAIANAAAAQARAASAASRVAASEAQAVAAASRAQAAAANSAAAASRAAGAQAQAAARSTAAQAQVTSAQLRAQAVQTLATAQANRAQAAASLQAARATQQTNNNNARALLQQQRMAQQAAQQANQGTTAIDQMGAALNRLIRLYVVYRGVAALGAFVREGMDFNTVVESATLGIASLITASAKIRDANGQVLEGAQALGAAYTIAADQMQKLRIAGLETKATTVELAEAMQQAIGPGLSAGLNVDQIRELTVRIVQAAGAIGVPMNQLSYQIRSMLSGQITRNSRVANALQITNADIRNWKEAGTLADHLNEKMQAFNVAGKDAAMTWSVIKSNMHEGVMVFAGDSTKTLFAELKKAGLDALSGIFDLRQLRITEQLQGLVSTLDQMFGGVGKMIGDAIRGGVAVAKELSAWFDKNRETVSATVESVFNMVRSFGNLIGAVVTFAGGLLGVAVTTNTLAATFDSISNVVNTIAGIIPQIATLMAASGLVGMLEKIAAVSVGMAPELIALAAAVTFLAGVVGALYLVTGQYARLADEIVAKQRRQELTTMKVATETGNLAQQYRTLKAQIDSGTLSDEAAASAKQKLATIVDELVRQNPSMTSALKSQAAESLNTASAVDKMTRSVETYLIRMTTMYRTQRLAKAEELKQAEATSNAANAGATSASLRKQAADRVAELKKELDTATQMEGQYLTALASIQPGREVSVTAPKPILKPKGESQLANADIADIREKLRLETEALNEALKRSLISYDDYRAGMRGVQAKAADEEIAAIQREINALSGTGDANRIKALKLSQQKIRDQLTRDGYEVEKTITEQATKYDAALANAKAVLQRGQGDLVAAAITKFDSGNASFIEEAKRNGDDAAVKLFEQADQALRMKQALEATRAAASQIQTEMETSILKTQRAQQEGTIDPKTAHDQIDAAYSDARDKLDAIKKAILALRDSGQASGPIVAATLDVIEKKMNAVEKAAIKADKSFKDFLDTFVSAETKSLATFLDSGIDKVHGLADAFRELALGVVQSIRKIISEMLALKIMQDIVGLFNNSDSTTALTISSGLKAAGFGGFAEGGYISGPGSGVSDSIPALLSNGEYVMKASTVQSIGRETLDMMNYGSSRTPVRGRRAFADGGMVVGSSGAAGGHRGGFDAQIGLEPGLVAKHIGTREGTKAVIGVIGDNRKSIRAALGL